MNKTAAVFSFKEIVFLIFFFMFYFAYKLIKKQIIFE